MRGCGLHFVSNVFALDLMRGVPCLLPLLLSAGAVPTVALHVHVLLHFVSIPSEKFGVPSQPVAQASIPRI